MEILSEDVFLFCANSTFDIGKLLCECSDRDNSKIECDKYVPAPL